MYIGNNKGVCMQVILSKEIVEYGVCTEDVLHMLKACNKVILVDVYEPTLQDIVVLVGVAAMEEAKRKRSVSKWNSLINEFKDLTKE